MIAFPPELALVIAATRRALGDDAIDLDAIADPVTRWPLVLEIARWHRLDSFLCDALPALGSRVPEAIGARIEEGFRQGATRNMLLTGALTRISRTLEEAAIPFLVLKGPPLGLDAYGDLVHRRSRDLDILIPPEWISDGLRVLGEAGYVAERTFDAAQMRMLLRTDKEIKLYAGDLLLELHWGFSHIDCLFPVSAIAEEEPDRIDLAGHPIPVPAEGTRLAYLAFHAGRHFWFRLFWLADFAFYSRAHPETDWAAMLARAEALGQRRSFCLSVVLAARVFGGEVPDPIRRAWDDQPVLETWADELVALWSRLPRQDEAYRIDDSVMRVYRWMLRMYPEHRARILSRTLFRPTIHDMLAWPLPAPLRPLYYLIRPLRLASRVLSNH